MDTCRGVSYCILANVLALLLVSIPGYSANQIEANNPIHLSWSNNKNRFDFIFNPDEPINNIVKLESDATNFLTKALNRCTNHSACLIKDGQYLESYEVINLNPHRSQFISIGKEGPSASNVSFNSTLSWDCHERSEFSINHYCSTHWNPPAFMYKNGCNHLIEWHSPIRCHTNSTNYERPCYIYDSAGKLIDLTPWILSNGSSYEVDVSDSTQVKKMSINVCNEAHETCGPNVSSCAIDVKNGLIESGFNNLTSLKYDTKDKSVHLTSLGQYKQQCEGSRVKTVVHFICENKILTKTRPKLIRSSACEQIIEWETVHACPVVETKVKATECKIKYGDANIVIDLKQLVNNSTTIEVANFSVGGVPKKMIFGICQGLQRSGCGGRQSSTTSACLVDGTRDINSPLSANNSQIVGSITNSFIKLADDRLYLETSAINKTCTISSNNLNVTKQLGARIEFYCSSEAQAKPTYLGFDDCTYIFEWASPALCLESPSGVRLSSHEMKALPSMSDITNSTVLQQETKSQTTVNTGNVPSQKPRRKNPIIEIETNQNKSAHELHINTLNEAKKISQETIIKGIPSIAHQDATSSVRVLITTPGPEEDKVIIKPVTVKPRPRMDSTHKFFMISMIIMSLVGFVVVIFILDKKTRLRVPLSAIRRRAGQAFQPQPVPYSRVDNFNDSLDL